jgi:hypothetical protein
MSPPSTEFALTLFMAKSTPVWMSSVAPEFRLFMVLDWDIVTVMPLGMLALSLGPGTPGLLF